MGQDAQAYRSLVGKSPGKGPLERPRRRWKTNIRVDIRNMFQSEVLYLLHNFTQVYCIVPALIVPWVGSLTMDGNGRSVTVYTDDVSGAVCTPLLI
jgi:hypothetical protein